MAYKTILIAVDYGNEANKVLAKAQEIAKLYSASVHLVHVVEPIDVTGPYDMAPIVPIELEEQLVKRAQEFLQKLIAEQKLKEIHSLVRVGSIKSEIFALTEELNVDLIIIGTHGRHGVGLLLGSTATAVLHGTLCDVLAVRI